ncbi:MAG: hypothetical protein QXO15_03375 [Nitrososphaerota archaeon]
MSEEIYKRAIAKLFNIYSSNIHVDATRQAVVIKTWYGELTLPVLSQADYSFIFYFNELEKKIFEALPKEWMEKVLGTKITKGSDGFSFNEFPKDFWVKVDVIHKKVKELVEKLIKEFTKERIEAWVVATEMKGQ